MFDLSFYVDATGYCPFAEWLDSLNENAKDKAAAALSRLEQEGNLLKRPVSDYLRDGIYELRWRLGRVQYRALYFFNGKKIIVVSHGFTKEDKIPLKEIELAIRRKLEIKQRK